MVETDCSFKNRSNKIR